MKIYFASLSFFMFVSPAYALKYVIYTDQSDASRAREVVELMKTTYPFNKHRMEFEIVQLKPEELNCGSANGIDRLLTCDQSTDAINAMTARRGGDQAMIIKDRAEHGGSGANGGIPIMASGSNARVMLHEYLHTLGLCDEYSYSASEANMYCDTMGVYPNATVIEPLPAYSSDNHARREHRIVIPWYGEINDSTKITTGSSLGTGPSSDEKEVPNNTNIPSVLSEPVGLYPGKICINASPAKKTWVPGAKKTIMDDYNAGLGAALEKKVDGLLKSKGAPPKMEYSAAPVETAEIKFTEESPAVAGPEVNDSPRSFLKDFFGWLGNLFEGIRRTLSR